ncbi:MAG: hypothetical protein G01um101429_515 [Parcubacteria group bacterium Gr01-1014_29]|nr:MAG: hypothetical protein G01um101429_515 [Parcubacteria group bacterium Gr01-1014_29]
MAAFSTTNYQCRTERATLPILEEAAAMAAQIIFPAIARARMRAAVRYHPVR